MPEIKLEHVTKRWGKFYAVDDLDLVIENNSFVTLLGPSGCGTVSYTHLRRRRGGPGGLCPLLHPLYRPGVDLVHLVARQLMGSVDLSQEFLCGQFPLNIFLPCQPSILDVYKRQVPGGLERGLQLRAAGLRHGARLHGLVELVAHQGLGGVDGNLIAVDQLDLGLVHVQLALFVHALHDGLYHLSLIHI